MPQATPIMGTMRPGVYRCHRMSRSYNYHSTSSLVDNTGLSTAAPTGGKPIYIAAE